MLPPAKGFPEPYRITMCCVSFCRWILTRNIDAHTVFVFLSAPHRQDYMPRPAPLTPTFTVILASRMRPPRILFNHATRTISHCFLAILSFLFCPIQSFMVSFHRNLLLLCMAFFCPFFLQSRFIIITLLWWLNMIQQRRHCDIHSHLPGVYFIIIIAFRLFIDELLRRNNEQGCCIDVPGFGSNFCC